MISPECGANRSVEGVFDLIHRSSYSFPTYCGPSSMTISGGGPNVLVLLAVVHGLINVSVYVCGCVCACACACACACVNVNVRPI